MPQTAMNPSDKAPTLMALTDATYDGDLLISALEEAIRTFRLDSRERKAMLASCRDLRPILDSGAGETLQQRWDDFEEHVWPRWRAGKGRPSPQSRWRQGVWAMVISRAARPGQGVLNVSRYWDWVGRLPEDDPLLREMDRLEQAASEMRTYSRTTRKGAVCLGLRIMLARGYETLEEITEEDLKDKAGKKGPGADVLDAALCSIGALDRSPLVAAGRHRRKTRLSTDEMIDASRIPERFREITALYLQTYASRVSDSYTTLRSRTAGIAHFWRFIDEYYPEVEDSSQVLAVHGREFVGYAVELSERLRRSDTESREDNNITVHAWLSQARTFFNDVCLWATEEGSPLAAYAPPAVPIARKQLLGMSFQKAKRRREARMTATVLDLEREMPKIRAYAMSRWRAAETMLEEDDGASAQRAYAEAFWDWAILELLVQSGLRLQEARRLTALDVLKRKMPDGRVYYMLHVGPSKYDRARVIPIGDGLGMVIAEIVKHVRQFYGTEAIPACDNRDPCHNLNLPRTPYIFQGRKVPGAIGTTIFQERLKKLSRQAGARRSDGSALLLTPHDCRRVFASEHLNNNIPVHVIQALLGHATADTVMVYAKLYPTTMVEEYRKAVRGTYVAMYGEESLRNPTAEEWAAFERSCGLRDMGTHLCALPTGEHCPKGLVCLGCTHAQPKKSAIPVFTKMLTSHERQLQSARKNGEPPGQIAAREMEVGRIRHALRRAEELSEDVAVAIEGASG